MVKIIFVFVFCCQECRVGGGPVTDMIKAGHRSISQDQQVSLSGEKEGGKNSQHSDHPVARKGLVVAKSENAESKGRLHD